MKTRLSRIAAALAGLLLCGCSALRECRTPEIEIPERMFSAETDSLTVADLGWWEFYGDETLRGIIERTLERNKRILAAAVRVEQARQLYRISRAGQLPNLDFDAPFNYETNDYIRGQTAPRLRNRSEILAEMGAGPVGQPALGGGWQLEE